MQTHLAQSRPISEGKYRHWYTITAVLYLHNQNRRQQAEKYLTYTLLFLAPIRRRILILI